MGIVGTCGASVVQAPPVTTNERAEYERTIAELRVEIEDLKLAIARARENPIASQRLKPKGSGR